ncbi:zinc finger protein 385D isoform X2 [Periophthalmus magnuspinnatus]|uniref:zinc finger protein 385D isoform X2 n=1 Tax=Periophthalmus magnuspinnatus TaxID=409849 RepID=UPI00243711A1|nr:zinc finger protein 385D isoform X2 [Periophthalmus magnuspinnatus]
MRSCAAVDTNASPMDPVQKAVLNHTLSLSSNPKRRHVSCSLCQLRFNSQSQALAHYKGTKHAKKLKALDSPKTKPKASAVTKETTNPEPASVAASPVLNGTAAERRDVSPASSLSVLAPAALAPGPVCRPEPEPPLTDPPSDPEQEPGAEAELGPEDKETEEEKARRLLYCSLCKVAVNSASQLDAHNSGTKHKTMLEARSGLGSIKSFPRAGVKSKLSPVPGSSTGLQNKTFYCEICDVHVNSETQLKQHISSRRHKDRAAGKPAKPKYSPYSKPTKGQSKPPVKLPLGKDLQPLSSQILPAHLAAVAAAVAMGNTFPHRSTTGVSPTPNPALFQPQPIPASLLRPAPGPVRTSHPQVLFAPY